jgi:hypothetical protein
LAFGAATCARRCAIRAFLVGFGWAPWVGRCRFVLCSTWSFSVLLFGVIAGSSALLYKLGSRSGRGAQNRVRNGQTGSCSKRGRSNGICPPSRSMRSRARRGPGGVGNGVARQSLTADLAQVFGEEMLTTRACVAAILSLPCVSAGRLRGAVHAPADPARKP